jgi:hypothetical protein
LRSSQAFEFFSVRRQAAGTTSETALFSVSSAGDARAHHYLAVNKGASVTPSYPLDVAGDINLTGDIRKNGVVWNPVGSGGGSGLDITTVQAGDGEGVSPPDLPSGKVYMITPSDLNYPQTITLGEGLHIIAASYGGGYDDPVLNIASRSSNGDLMGGFSIPFTTYTDSDYGAFKWHLVYGKTNSWEDRVDFTVFPLYAAGGGGSPVQYYTTDYLPTITDSGLTRKVVFGAGWSNIWQASEEDETIMFINMSGSTISLYHYDTGYGPFYDLQPGQMAVFRFTESGNAHEQI